MTSLKCKFVTTIQIIAQDVGLSLSKATELNQIASYYAQLFEGKFSDPILCFAEILSLTILIQLYKDDKIITKSDVHMLLRKVDDNFNKLFHQYQNIDSKFNKPNTVSKQQIQLLQTSVQCLGTRMTDLETA